MNEKISIIIPVYNSEKYLGKCLDSIRTQSYKNLQVILIDDGSIDSSGKICDEYAKKDSRFETYHQKNTGQAAARNLGLTHAKGEWIGFVDNDDTIDIDMYEILYKNAKKNSVLISGCATNTIYEDGTSVNKFSDFESGIKDGDDFVLDILYQTQHAWGAMWNKIFHKSLIEKLKYPEGAQLEDYYVSIKLYHEVKKIYFDNRPMYNWFQRSTSQSKKVYGIDKLSIFEIAEKINNYCLETHNDSLSLAGNYFLFIAYSGLIWNVYKYGDESAKKIAKNKCNIATKNLKKIHVMNNKINKVTLVKYLVKFCYCKYKLRGI